MKKDKRDIRIKQSSFKQKKTEPIVQNITKMVGLDGLEPSTSRLSDARSNQLSYKPIYKQQHNITIFLFNKQVFY